MLQHRKGVPLGSTVFDWRDAATKALPNTVQGFSQAMIRPAGRIRRYEKSVCCAAAVCARHVSVCSTSELLGLLEIDQILTKQAVTGRAYLHKDIMCRKCGQEKGHRRHVRLHN